MVQAPVEQLTLKAFLSIPETKPASEFIDGKIIHKPIPQGQHSLLQLSLLPAINNVLRGPKIALALPEIRCTFSGRSICQTLAFLLGNGSHYVKMVTLLTNLIATPTGLLRSYRLSKTQRKSLKKFCGA